MESIIGIVVALGIGLGAFFIYRDFQRTRQPNNNSGSSSSSTRSSSNTAGSHIPAPKVVRPDVDSMSKAQLLDYARELNLKVNVRNRKVDILNKIKNHLENE